VHVDASWARIWLESHRYFPVTLTKGESWAPLRVCTRVDHTGKAFLHKPGSAWETCHGIFILWVNSQNFNRVKTMGTHGKINAIWWNIKINLHKLVDICGYESPTNVPNFTQKDLTEVKIFQKVLGCYFFSETPCILCHKITGYPDKLSRPNHKNIHSPTQSDSIWLLKCWNKFI